MRRLPWMEMLMSRISSATMLSMSTLESVMPRACEVLRYMQGTMLKSM